MFILKGDKMEIKFVQKAGNGTKVIVLNEKQKIPAPWANATKQADFTGKSGKTCTILGGKEKVILIGLGKNRSALDLQKAGGSLAQATQKEEALQIEIVPLSKSTLSTEQAAAHFAFGMLLGGYRFDKYITKKIDEKPRLKTVSFIVDTPKAAQNIFAPLATIAASVAFGRDLCNEPANALTPALFAERAETLKKSGVIVDVLGPQALKEQKMDMMLSVAQGSINEPRAVIMQWRGNPNKDDFDIGLVGKGVTFDSGGISLKPGAGMGDMKQDMSGAAVVTSTIKALAEQKTPINIVGIIGLVENMPSGSATRPGDIVTSMSGQTVEILNTDAEGRLVLGDCLWYLQTQFGVKKIIDLATLTGAVAHTLGTEYAGIFANNDKFADTLIKAGETSGEKLWRLPMCDAYNKMIDSPIADMKNIGGAIAGGSTAACFLGRFIQEDVTWAHLDIAGVDNETKNTPLVPKGATAFGVRLLNTLLTHS